jgi:hypothetical protein
MGQKQGLLVMYGIAAVAVVFAMAAAFGAFDDSPAKAARQGDGSGASGGSGAQGPAGAPKNTDTSKSTQLLLASVQHYADLLASGQKIVGHTHYASVTAYGQAFSNPKSPAATFAKYRVSPNPEADTTYTDAEQQAAAAYGGDHSGAFDQWLNDMAKTKSDLGDWVSAAVQFQQGATSQAKLDAAAGLVTQDLAKAKADTGSLGG